jgi:tetratricopeptide (TPR) repeat protein
MAGLSPARLRPCRPLHQTLVELPEAAVHGALAHLQAAEFLYETRLFPERAFTFKHALTHEVAYNGLLQGRRRALHARIVEALEGLSPDRLTEQVEWLAHHALRGEAWTKALAYNRQAGDKALARSAHREAVGYFEQTLRVLPHLPETRDTRTQAIDLRLALRTALRPLGNAERILQCLREAETLAAALDDPRRLGQIAHFLSNHFYVMGVYDQAMSAAQRAFALATAGGDGVLQVLPHYYLGQAYLAQGDYRRAIDCFGQIVASLGETRDDEHFGQVLLPAVSSRAFLSECQAELGLFAEGQVRGAEGLRIAEAVGHPGSLMIASWGLGLLALRHGDLSRALPLLERAVAICHAADLPVRFPRMAAALGAAYTLAGRVTEAVPLLTQAVAQTTATAMVCYQALCHLALGEAQLRAGHLEDAHAEAERTLALARERQERGHQAYALRLLGDIVAWRDPSDLAQAGEYYQQALVLADELAMRPLQAHCHRSLGTLYAAIGEQESARTELSTAIEMYQAMDMMFWLPQTETALAQMEGR